MSTENRAEDIVAIVVAAGRSERMGGEDKLWALLAGPDGRERPLLAYAVAALQRCDGIGRIALVLAADSLPRGRELVQSEHFDRICAVVAGGARRRDSVRAGLDALGACGWVVVHDGARPLVPPELIERGIEAARETGAACCALRARDTVKEEADGFVARTRDRSRFWLAQTPQVFRYDLLMKAHAKVSSDATDDASMVEALGVRVKLFEGSTRNIKVTTPDDLAQAQALLLTQADSGSSPTATARGME